MEPHDDKAAAAPSAEDRRLSDQADPDLLRQVHEAVFNQLPAGLWLISPQGEITRANLHAQAMLNSTRRSDLSGWWADSGEAVAATDWPGMRAARSGEPVAARVIRVRNRLGDERHINCAAAPLQAADGRRLGAIVTATDVSAEFALASRLLAAEDSLRRQSLNQFTRHEEQMAALSRELHDNLGQVLSLLKMHLATAVRPETNDHRRALELAEALPLVDVALGRLREVCGELRPSELSDFGLGAALVSLAGAASRASGVAVSFEETGDPADLGTGLELGLFRVAQQALTNALRHSGAPAVWIALHWRAGAVELSVRDNGVGFDPTATRRPNQQGLQGMRERMELLGGLLRVDASFGVGSTVCAMVSAPTERGDGR